MQPNVFEEQASGPSPKFLLFTLFRHKWKILCATVVGLLAASCVYYFQTPIYQSNAKLLVRYVLDRSTVDPVESTANGSKATDSVIGSEVEILTSWDLAMQVAEGVGVERLLPEASGANKVDAAASILAGLSVNALKGSNVILVSYKNSNPILATLVLEEMVNRYFTKHLEVHRSAGAFEFVTQQTDQVRSRLSQTEDELKRLKAKAHVISLSESTASLSASLAKIQDELYAAEAERAEQRARVVEIEKTLTPRTPKVDEIASNGQTEMARRRASPGEIQQYDALIRRLSQLRQMEFDLLAKYTMENTLVKRHQAEIVDLDQQRARFEERYPHLTAKVSDAAPIQAKTLDLETEQARLSGIEARIEALKFRDRAIKESAAQFSELAPQIAQLERKKELEEADFKYFGASLEKARIDEALDPSKMPNISAVQKPSPAVKVTSGRDKILFGLVGGGIACGMLLAFFMDFIVDTSIKLPMEIESRMRLPLLLAIPEVRNKRQLRIAKRIESDTDAIVNVRNAAPWDEGHFIRPFAEVLRDRLVLYFELKKMVYKPKLVAVTGCSGGEGVSTIAAGLAAALSETGDGKVLLVDMNIGGREAHRFFAGKETSSLIDAIEGGSSIPSAAENLYLAKAAPAAGTSKIIPKRFYDLVPNFKATDFDYIIFDMPPLAQGSIALAMSGFMDKVLLVVEAEKSPREVVKRTYTDLIDARADVAIVFNQMRSYSPQWIQGAI